MNYTIVREHGLWELIKEVNAHIDKGYKPLGGITQITYLDGRTGWAQAVYLKESPFIPRFPK